MLIYPVQEVFNMKIFYVYRCDFINFLMITRGNLWFWVLSTSKTKINPINPKDNSKLSSIAFCGVSSKQDSSD